MDMVFIEWNIKATGEVKVTKEPIERHTAEKLVNFLNQPNSASSYAIKDQE